MRHLALGVFAAALFLAAPAAAQDGPGDRDAEWLRNCLDNRNGDRDGGRACEVRAVQVRLSGRLIEIDGRQNGSVRAQGWEGSDVKVTAHLQAQADNDGEAAELLRQVRIVSDGRGIRAEGPSGHRASWSVSYLAWVPRAFDLDFEAHNGSLGVTGVSGRIGLRTVNGSVSLDDVGGDVRARTQNGSLRLNLTGSKWTGSGVDAETRNGSVRLSLPEKYAATLETGTVNGRINTDIPITVRGRLSHRLTVPLNGGGATIRAITTNGSVTITQR